MATTPMAHGAPTPGSDGRLLPTAVSVIGLGAVIAAPIAAVSLWLLLTDPTAAGSVAERGDLLPLARALVAAVGRALAAVLAYL